MSTIPKGAAERGGLRSWRTWVAVLCWLGFILIAPSIIAGHTRGPVIFPTLLLGILAMRHWCRRRALAVLSKKPKLANSGTIRYFVRTLWSYGWRSFVVFVVIGGLVGSVADSSAAAGVSMGMSLGTWILCSLFTLDGRSVLGTKGIRPIRASAKHRFETSSALDVK